MKLDYYGFWIEKNYYPYNKKYRVVEIIQKEGIGNYKYCLQIKRLFKWETIIKYEYKCDATGIYNMIKQRRKIKLKIIIGD